MNKPPRPPASKASASSPVKQNPRSKARATATFKPYYWEPYNQIVEPRRFDHYLLRRWMPSLGILGLAIVKALRDRCYHNPLTGDLRDECEVKMQDLADQLGVNRSTLFREFDRNKALGEFVTRVPQYQLRGGKMVQAENAFRVSMDDPIHPDDMELYNQLHAERQRDRQNPPPTSGGRRLKGDDTPAAAQNAQTNPPAPSESQFATLNGKQGNSQFSSESQSETPDTTYLPSQNESADTQYLPGQNASPIVNLPSGGYLPLLTPAAGPPIYPPGDDPEEIEGELRSSLMCALWTDALKTLANRVNKPTFETHLKALQLLSMERDEESGQITATLAAPSAFSREWVEKRSVPILEEVLSQVRDEAVTVKVVVGKG